jgi:hypothetical protein
MRLATVRASRVSTTATSRSNNYYNIEMIEGATAGTLFSLLLEEHNDINYDDAGAMP